MKLKRWGVISPSPPTISLTIKNGRGIKYQNVSCFKSYFFVWKVDIEQKIIEVKKPYFQRKRHFQRKACLFLFILSTTCNRNQEYVFLCSTSKAASSAFLRVIL